MLTKTLTASLDFLRWFSILLLASGLATCLVLVFKQLISYSFHQIALQSEVPTLYLVSPFIGALILILLFRYMSEHTRSGLPLVVTGYHFGDGQLQVGNLIYQYVAATVSLFFGFAVGAVGPSLHIGAAGANLLGQFGRLNEAPLKTLTACGAASAMAALFHTPVTAVFFVFETIIRRFEGKTLFYVTISAFVAAWISSQMGTISFHVDSQNFRYQVSLIPELILLGFCCSALATLMLKLVRFTAEQLPWPYWGKFMLAAAVTCIASFVGINVLGLGDSLQNTLLYDDQVSTLILLWLAVRFFISAIVIGSAIPGGALGPSLVLGALTGKLISLWLPNEAPQVFVLVGMAAFLAAVLKSPLASILLILEITGDINMLFPTLVGTISASLLQNKVFGQQNLIELLLARQNILLKNSPSLAGKK